MIVVLSTWTPERRAKATKNTATSSKATVNGRMLIGHAVVRNVGKDRLPTYQVSPIKRKGEHCVISL
jgi:hypothetical protein